MCSSRPGKRRNLDRSNTAQRRDNVLDQDFRSGGSGCEANDLRALHPFGLERAAVRD